MPVRPDPALADPVPAAPRLWRAQRSPGAVPGAARRTIGTRVLSDLTERVSATARLALLEALAGVTHEALFETLVEGLATTVGTAHAYVAERLEPGGTHLHILAGWSDEHLVEPFDLQAAGTPWLEIITHGLRAWHGTALPIFPVGCLAGSVPSASFVGIELRDHAGRVIGVLAVAHDRPLPLDEAVASTLRLVGARAAAEIEHRYLERSRQVVREDLDARVRRRTAELEDVNRELEAFSYSASHDLRAPLRQIAGFAALVAHAPDVDVSADVRRHVADIADAARSMNALIEAMIDISKAAHAPLQSAPVEMTALVRNVVTGLSRETADRRIDWAIGPLPVVRGDAVLLRQVVYNLLSNAVKFSRVSDPARIEIGSVVADEPGEIVCYVRDNGVGFDMRHADGLFGAFRRLHDAAAFEGTGIGLANVRRIVQRHGGRVWVTAAPGVGATFFVSLPAATLDVSEAARLPLGRTA